MFLGLLFVLGNLLNNYLNSFESIESWNKFKIEYNKTYTTHNEELQRQEIFMENLRTCIKHNLQQAAGLSTFKMGINQFSDMTYDEFLKINTELASNEKYMRKNYNATVIHNVLSEPINESSSFDWRDHNAVTSVKNQRDCGCCYAFAGISCLESKLYLTTGKTFDLSEQEIVDCAHGYFTAGCYGGYEIGALNYIQNNGEISEESDYPYVATQEKCKKNAKSSNKISVSIKRFLQVPKDENELMRALVKHGPIMVSIDHLHESFMRYRNGIYYESDCKKQNSHAALLVGFGTENGNDYWTVKNSFGEKWGENGYFRIARNRKNNCEIASEAYIIDM